MTLDLSRTKKKILILFSIITFNCIIQYSFVAHRLVQNRKSAQKCRLKKKAEFYTMRDDIQKYKQENIGLKDKVSITISNYFVALAASNWLRKF